MSQIDDQSISTILDKVTQLAKKVGVNPDTDLSDWEAEMAAARSNTCPSCGSCDSGCGCDCDCEPCDCQSACCPVCGSCEPCECRRPTRGISMSHIMQAIDDINRTIR